MNRKTLGFMWWTLISFASIILFIKYNFAVWTYLAGSILLCPGIFLLYATHKKSWIYRNKFYQFELALPAGWNKGLFESSSNLTFYGPSREFLRIAIGPIAPIPDVQTQQNNLVELATNNGHKVLEVGTIQVCEKDHATMLVEVPGFGTLKNYSVIINDIEYLVSSNVEIANSILQSFKLYHDFERLDRFYAKHNLH
jgi:hypothetical protein